MSRNSRSCELAAETLKKCLRDTDCFKSGEYSMKECLQRGNECRDLANAYFICMRGQLDMRSRIQGFKASGGIPQGDAPPDEYD